MGQDGDEPEEVTADSSSYQHGDDHPAVGSFGHEPGPSDADEAPECGEDDDREGKGMGCHGWVRDAQVGYQIERHVILLEVVLQEVTAQHRVFKGFTLGSYETRMDQELSGGALTEHGGTWVQSSVLPNK